MTAEELALASSPPSKSRRGRKARRKRDFASRTTRANDARCEYSFSSPDPLTLFPAHAHPDRIDRRNIVAKRPRNARNRQLQVPPARLRNRHRQRPLKASGSRNSRRRSLSKSSSYSRPTSRRINLTITKMRRWLQQTFPLRLPRIGRARTRDLLLPRRPSRLLPRCSPLRNRTARALDSPSRPAQGIPPSRSLLSRSTSKRKTLLSPCRPNKVLPAGTNCPSRPPLSPLLSLKGRPRPRPVCLRRLPLSRRPSHSPKHHQPSRPLPLLPQKSPTN